MYILSCVLELCELWMPFFLGKSLILSSIEYLMVIYLVHMDPGLYNNSLSCSYFYKSIILKEIDIQNLENM